MLQASELTCVVQLNPGGSMFLLTFGTTQQKRQPSTVMNTSVNKIVSSFKCSLPIDFSDQIFLLLFRLPVRGICHTDNICRDKYIKLLIMQFYLAACRLSHGSRHFSQLYVLKYPQSLILTSGEKPNVHSQQLMSSFI